MKKEPIWLDGIKFSEAKKLDKDINVDVLIIGGGITGLSTAYHLMNSNLKVCLVEKNLIANAVSARTTGKLTYLQDNIYTKLKEKGKKYYDSQRDAIKIVEKIIKKNKIDCDYQKVSSYIYTENDNAIDKIKKEEEWLKKLNIEYEKCDDIDFIKYGIKVNDTAVFHPIKYLNELKKIIINNGIDIYENSNVDSLKKEKNEYVCEVNGKNIKAEKVVVAVHYPFFLFPFMTPLRTYIEKSYLSATMVNENKPLSAITISSPVKSIRYHKDYFLYLTSTHNLCMKCNSKDNFMDLLSDLNEMNLKPDYIWSNQDIMTEDNLPYIGYIDDNLLLGTGYNTWGMTNGSIAGKILSDLILNKRNKYKKLFDPKRTKNIKDIIKYPLNMGYNIKSFVGNKVIKNKAWYNSNVKFTTLDNKAVAIYIDEHKKEHIVYNLCPHLKCSLIFNEVEKTWDCPCHGSRFDIDGKCIFGPSKYDICYKKNR